METKRIYKSRTDVKIDGVCAGVAKFFNIDAKPISRIEFNSPAAISPALYKLKYSCDTNDSSFISFWQFVLNI